MSRHLFPLLHLLQPLELCLDLLGFIECRTEFQTRG
uniref:Uncharacterized protein n=1 Tax=Lotus japonicus TaxID=34305 RepID=I3S5X9_LOTJA|nr:unknown [Lotus japonicus]